MFDELLDELTVSLDDINSIFKDFTSWSLKEPFKFIFSGELHKILTVIFLMVIVYFIIKKTITTDRKEIFFTLIKILLVCLMVCPVLSLLSWIVLYLSLMGIKLILNILSFIPLLYLLVMTIMASIPIFISRFFEMLIAFFF